MKDNRPVIRTIAMQVKPRLDSIMAYWLLKKFGKNRYRGLVRAKLEFMASNNIPDRLQGDDVILLGRGGGKYDEHPTIGHPRVPNECCATLVAEDLGVRYLPELYLLLERALNEDLKAGSDELSLAYLVKVAHLSEVDEYQVIKHVFQWLNYFYQSQLVLSQAEPEYQEVRHCVVVPGENNNELPIVWYESDQSRMNIIARRQTGDMAAIVIQKRSSGNIQIFSNKRYRLDVAEIARVIRTAERKVRGLGDEILDWKKLEGEQPVAGAECWTYHKGGGMLLNGSLTTPEVEPTKIPFDQLVQLVVMTLDQTVFPDSRLAQCSAGRCTATKNNPCGLYDYGLKRCRRIRYRSYNAS